MTPLLPSMALAFGALTQLCYGVRRAEITPYLEPLLERGVGSPDKDSTDVREIRIDYASPSAISPSAPPLPISTKASEFSESSPSASPSPLPRRPRRSGCANCFTSDHPYVHCSRLVDHTQDAIEHLVLSVLALPVHVAMGVGGAFWCPVAAVGSAWDGRFRDASEYAALTLAKPIGSVVGGAALGAASLGLTLGNTCCALYHIAALPIASCHRIFTGPPTEDEWQTCKHDVEVFKQKQGAMSDQMDAWNERLADFTLYSGPGNRRERKITQTDPV